MVLHQEMYSAGMLDLYHKLYHDVRFLFLSAVLYQYFDRRPESQHQPA